MAVIQTESGEKPKLILCGVLLLVLLGGGGYSLMAGRSPETPVEAESERPVRMAAATRAEDPDSVDARLQAMLPGLYNPDPFRPAVTAPSTPAAPPRPAPVKRAGTGGPEWRNPPLPFAELFPPLGRGGRREAPSDRRQGLPPAQPLEVTPQVDPRPQARVTGVIEAEDGNDMAFLMVDQEHRLVRVGDQLSGGYEVTRIRLEGVWLSNGKDSLFLPLATLESERGASRAASQSGSRGAEGSPAGSG